jgi:hypothetical protein
VQLTRRQRNALLGALNAHNLQPTEFFLTVEHQPAIGVYSDCTVINHPRSESVFRIYMQADTTYMLNCMVGKSFWRGTDKVDWAVLENTFHSWAEEVQLEVESPDMWEEIRQSSELLDASSGELANTPFTESELAQISKQLREVKTYVREVCSLTAEEAADVEKRFDDAEKASRRMGRKDWLLLFLGTLFPLIYQDSCRRML